MDNSWMSQQIATPEPETDIVAELWHTQSIWSQAANRAKAAVGRARVGGLALITTAAILSALGPALSKLDSTLGNWVIGVAASCLALVPLVRQGANHHKVQSWTRLRSVAEALKSEIYTYLAGGAPYGEPSGRPDLLRQRADRVLAMGDDLLPQLPHRKPGHRELPAIVDVDSYIRLRVMPQIENYYRPRAAVMGMRARRAEILQIVLAVIAVGIGVATSFDDTGATPWLAVVATVSGAFAAHAAASRFSHNQLEYLRTEHHLKRLLSDPDRQSMVNRSEHVISIQNEGWMAELVTFDPDQPGQSRNP